MTTTATIYARVPCELKDTLDVYADRRGMSLAGAVTHLLRIALDVNELKLTQEIGELKTRMNAVEACRLRECTVKS